MLVQYAYAILSTVDLVFCLDWFFLSNENIETPSYVEKSSTSKSYTYVMTYTHQVFVSIP
jgi:hypothetical protein